MKHYHFGFYVSSKARTHELGRALAQGARVHGDTVELISQDNWSGVVDNLDGAAVLGMAMAAKRLLREYIKAGKHCLMFDKGYMQRKFYKRVSVDAWQPLAYFQRRPRPHDRLERMMSGAIGDVPFRILDRRTPSDDAAVLIAGTCQAHNNFHDLGNVTEYHDRLVQNVRKYSEREIVYRPNPAWALKHAAECRAIPGTRLSSPETDFRVELMNAHLLITHGSSAAFSALAAGVPVMVLGEGIARPMALGNKDWKRIEEPFWPKDKHRRQFFADAAYCQWTDQEYASGEAWGYIREALDALEREGPQASLFELITQYRQMHEDKHFRGLGTVKYFAPIARLIMKTGSTSLLDFGCGKGAQYETPYELQKGWEIPVACYDPAVEQYAQLPPGSFDGVICLDVMEHIPEHAVAATLQQIIGLADKFVFFSIAGAPANKTLPDGRNCHLTVRPEQWWSEQIALAQQAVNKSDLRIKLIMAVPEDEDEEPVGKPLVFDVMEDCDEEALPLPEPVLETPTGAF